MLNPWQWFPHMNSSSWADTPNILRGECKNFLLAKRIYFTCYAIVTRLAHKWNTPPHVMETIVEVMQNITFVHNCADTTVSHNSESQIALH